MAVKEKKRVLKPIEICPNGHYYNSSRTGEICDVCGTKLDPPKDPEELYELTHIDEKDWIRGLLVCIRGPNKGNGYFVKEGKNYIGSASSMNIQIIGDKKIEKHNHAVIVYDQKSKKTMLLPGESRGIIYWQSHAIFEPQELKGTEKIELGESAFSYLQFNVEDYEWQADRAVNQADKSEEQE